MDLFDTTPNEEPGGPACRLCGMPFDFCECGSVPPLDDELEARFLGEERAGIPSWSHVSTKRIAAALDRLLAAAGERRSFLEHIEEESYKAARRRRLARVATEVGVD